MVSGPPLLVLVSETVAGTMGLGAYLSCLPYVSLPALPLWGPQSPPLSIPLTSIAFVSCLWQWLRALLWWHCPPLTVIMVGGGGGRVVLVTASQGIDT